MKKRRRQSPRPAIDPKIAAAIRRAVAQAIGRASPAKLDLSKPFLDSDEFAALAHTTKRTVERWRREGTGPPFLRVNGRVLYDRDVTTAWIRSNSLSSTSAPQAA